jgi:hypothetical protein
MTSPAGSPTGVQITRQFTIRAGSSRVNLDLAFHNISQRKIRWSIWDVVQLAAERITEDGRLNPERECVVTAPLNSQSKFGSGYYVMFGDPQNPQWHSDKKTGLFYGDYKWEIGKVGLDSRGGWAAFVNKASQQAFVIRYTPFDTAEYPDDGAAVEFWTVGRGKVANLDYEKSDIYLMEVEILSPFQLIEPGQTASFQIEWGACRCPGPIVDVTEGGCAGTKLTAKRSANQIQVCGKFGVFDEGRLHVDWIDLSGKVIDSVPVGIVSPAGVVSLDEMLDAPDNTSRARLVVRAHDAQYVLAEAEIS